MAVALICLSMAAFSQYAIGAKPVTRKTQYNGGIINDGIALFPISCPLFYQHIVDEHMCEGARISLGYSKGTFGHHGSNGFVCFVDNTTVHFNMDNLDTANHVTPSGQSKQYVCKEAHPNIVFEYDAGVGGWGGECTCPSGAKYLVGDNWNGCTSLACDHGTSGTCNQKYGDWSNRKVECEPAHTLKVGDLVVAKWPDNRGKSDNPWFPGQVTAINIDSMTCSIAYADGDESDLVHEDEVLYAPGWPDSYGTVKIVGRSIFGTNVIGGKKIISAITSRNAAIPNFESNAMVTFEGGVKSVSTRQSIFFTDPLVCQKEGPFYRRCRTASR